MLTINVLEDGVSAKNLFRYARNVQKLHLNFSSIDGLRDAVLALAPRDWKRHENAPPEHYAALPYLTDIHVPTTPRRHRIQELLKDTVDKREKWFVAQSDDE